jgi:pyruvate formate lyase activating enzyme
METVREAILWEGREEQRVHCSLCSHHCLISPGKRGICGVRENQGGKLYTLVYGNLVAENADPIEKKPLFHFAPGSISYSIATAGCNFRCGHCQNYTISQVQRDQGKIPGRPVAPEEVVRRAVENRCRSIAYTYTEPTIFFEYALDCMKLAHQAGLLNVFVTNGYMTNECIEAMAGHLDAANVDLKAMTDRFYREICGARLDPVLQAIRLLWQRGVWTEVTTLVIPQHNEAPAELREIARFLVSVSRDLPWHVTGFYPTYRLNDVPPTPVSALTAARRIGLEEGLRYVYVGNRVTPGGEDTHCPECGRRVVRRLGFSVTEVALNASGGCAACGYRIAGVEIGGTP